jgi:hypothetical protein
MQTLPEIVLFNNNTVASMETAVAIDDVPAVVKITKMVWLNINTGAINVIVG